MKYTTLSVSIAALLFSTASAFTQPLFNRKYLFTDPENPGYKPILGEEVPEMIKAKLNPVDLPDNHNWGNVDGVNFLTNIKN